MNSALKFKEKPPVLFAMACRMRRSRIRGDQLLMRVLRRLGMLDVVVLHKIGSAAFGVPLRHADWDTRYVQEYEAEAIEHLSNAIRGFEDVTFFDCGADIGTFSAHLSAKAKSITRVVAFEPNPDAQSILQWNLEQLPGECTRIPKAVSYFSGTGKLVNPPEDPNSVARYLAPGEGPIMVDTIDSVGIRGGDIAVKIDVEGGELDVLRGAAKTIREARSCAVMIEAHPKVSARTGRDPVECLRFLETLRPFRFTVAETGERITTAGNVIRPGQTEIWNIIAA